MMSVDGLRELDEMATKLQATAHKLTQSPKRDELLRDIEELRVQITLRISAHKSENKNGKHGRTPAQQTWLINKQHVAQLIDLGLVEMRENNPRLTVAGQDAMWRA